MFELFHLINRDSDSSQLLQALTRDGVILSGMIRSNQADFRWSRVKRSKGRTLVLDKINHTHHNESFFQLLV